MESYNTYPSGDNIAILHHRILNILHLNYLSSDICSGWGSYNLHNSTEQFPQFNASNCDSV